MFGKIRLGKSNVVKLIAQAILDATETTPSVGQLIFDINGEYANNNAQDGNTSLREANQNRCVVYALTPREQTPSNPLRLNFYEQPDTVMEIIASLLAEDGKTSDYIKAFASTEIPSVDMVKQLTGEEKTRPIRKIQIFWAILNKAGFSIDNSRLKNLGIMIKGSVFNPRFNKSVRDKIYADKEKPDTISNIDQLTTELEYLIAYERDHSGDLKSSSGKPLLDNDDLALLNFLLPRQNGSGPSILRPYIRYHAPNASKFIDEILKLLGEGKTVILDLGNANDKIRKFFSDMLSTAVFKKQEEKFVSDQLENHYVQLYFEEAHNLFPPDNKEFTGIYTRFAKEGAKFHIGMVYSTQSPSTINKELLIQTENFFVGHLSSQGETKALSRLQITYQGIEEDILKARTPGFMRMLTRSHRFVIPVQANKFEAKQK